MLFVSPVGDASGPSDHTVRVTPDPGSESVGVSVTVAEVPSTTTYSMSVVGAIESTLTVSAASPTASSSLVARALTVTSPCADTANGAV